MNKTRRFVFTNFANVAMVAMVGVLGAWAIFSCGGDSKTPPTGTPCVQNSECNNPLSCSFGTCHQACIETRDCPLGQRCVKDVSGFNVCQLATEQGCLYNSLCKQPLICASDFQCRNQCLASVDCIKGQSCIENVCAEPADVDPVTGKLKPAQVPPGDGGATDGPLMSMPGVDGGAGGDGGMTTITDAAVPTTPIPVDSVTADKPIVRQGELGILVTVTAPSGLTGASAPKVGDCSATIQPGGTATSVVVRVSCQHGTALGAKDLSFQTATGVVTKAGVITVTAITASPAGVDTASGSSAAPYRTLKKALSVTAAGDTVMLMDGEYNAAGGDDFKDKIPSGITLLGQSAAGTKLVGVPNTNGINADVDGYTLTVKNLTFSYFQYGIYVTKQAKLTFENVKITNSQYYGVYASVSTTSAAPTEIAFTGDDSAVVDSTSWAIYLYAAKDLKFAWNGKGMIKSSGTSGFYINPGDTADVSITGATISAMNSNGTAFSGSAAVNAFNVKFDQVAFVGGIDFNGSTAVVSVKDSNINRLAGSGNAISFAGSKLTLASCTIAGGYMGLGLSSGAAILRGTKFNGYSYHGVYPTGIGTKVDLGNATELGINDFIPASTNVSGYAIYDGRPMSPDPITASEVTISGNPMSPGTYKNTGGTTQSVAKQFFIATLNNSIIVY